MKVPFSFLLRRRPHKHKSVKKGKEVGKIGGVFAFHGAPERRTDEEEWGGEERDGVGSERLDERRQRSVDRLMENAPPPSISLMTVAKEKGAGQFILSIPI